MTEEMKTPYGYIYKTTNLVNGKIYIGQHKYEGKVKNYIGSGTLLQKAIKKYGKEKFKIQIIEICYSLKELNKREIHWISFYNSTNKKIGYNIEEGGSPGPVLEETKKKISIMTKKAMANLQIKEKISKAATGKHPSEETRKKMSNSHKGKATGKRKPLSKKHKKKLSISLTGKRRSKEIKEKMKEAQNRPEVKKKISESVKKRLNDPKIKKVQSENGKKYWADLEKRKKRSQDYMGIKNPSYGRKHTEEEKQKMKESWIKRRKKNENNNMGS